MSDASSLDLVIRPALATDAAPLARIYNHYIRETTVTFEEAPLSARDMAARIERVCAIPLPWLVAEVKDRLVGELGALGVHAAIGGIALPNEASVALHEALGFERVAEFREVGFKFQKWIDVGYWQRIL